MLSQHRMVRKITRSVVAKRAGEILLIAATLVFAGCAGRPSLIPNPDPALRHTSAQFAAQAAKAQYAADAPHEKDPNSRAEVDYNFKELHLSNLSDADWQNVEVWVNQRYSVLIPKIKHSTSNMPYLEKLNFQLLFDNNGNSFPISNTQVKKVEIVRGGTVYDVPLQLAD